MTQAEYDARHSALTETYARELMRRTEVKDLTKVPALARSLATETLGERPKDAP